MIYFAIFSGFFLITLWMGVLLGYIKTIERELTIVKRRVESLQHASTTYGSMYQPPAATTAYRPLFLVDPTEPPMAS